MRVTKVEGNILQGEASGDCELEEGPCFVQDSDWLRRAIAQAMGGRTRALKSPRVLLYLTE